MLKILKSILYIVKYIFVAFIIMMIMCMIQDEGLIYDDDLAFTFVNLVSVVVFMIMIKLEKKNVKEHLKFNILNRKSIIPLIALAIGTFFINLSLIPLLSNYLPSNNSADGITFTSAIYATLVAPICEEILFRGIIFNKLKSSFNLILAVLIQALIFGLAHGHGDQSVHAGLGGIIYCIAFLWTDSIWASILLHFLNNFFVTVVILLVSLFGLGKEIMIPPYIISLLGIVIFIIAAKSLFNITHKISHEDKYMILKQ